MSSVCKGQVRARWWMWTRKRTEELDYKWSFSHARNLRWIYTWKLFKENELNAIILNLVCDFCLPCEFYVHASSVCLNMEPRDQYLRLSLDHLSAHTCSGWKLICVFQLMRSTFLCHSIFHSIFSETIFLFFIFLGSFHWIFCC